MRGSVPVLAATGPVLLFGDCYGNLQATTSLLGEARRLGIEADYIVCTADIERTAPTLRRQSRPCEQAACTWSEASVRRPRQPRPQIAGCGFTPGSACGRSSASWYAHTDAELGAEARRCVGACRSDGLRRHHRRALRASVHATVGGALWSFAQAPRLWRIQLLRTSPNAALRAPPCPSQAKSVTVERRRVHKRTTRLLG